MDLKKRTEHRAARRQARGQTIALWSVTVVVLLLVGGAAWYFTHQDTLPFQTTAAKATPDYHTAAVQRGDISISASGSGTLIASQTVDLSFGTKGTVATLNVKMGDSVKAGQVLAKLADSPSLEADVASAQLQLVQAQQDLENLQQNNDTALAQAYQAWVKAEQDYNTALTKQQRMAYARCSKDVTTKYAAEVAKDQAALAGIAKELWGSDQYTQAQNALATAQANYTYCAGYTPDEKTTANANFQAAQVTMQQAQTNYNTLKAASGIDPNTLALDEAKVEQAKAQLAQAQQALTGTTITAPRDGTVTYIAAGQGTMVGTSKFITIADVSHPIVQVSIDETDLSKLSDGSSAQVVFDAMPNQSFTGKVTQVNPQLTTSGQYQVATGLVALDNSSAARLEHMPLGLNANVTVIEKQANNVLLVPVSALRDLGGGQYAVFVQTPTGLQLRPVQVGLMDTTHAEIKQGLKQGDVVSTGASQAAQ